jgi:hypothetical protein
VLPLPVKPQESERFSATVDLAIVLGVFTIGSLAVPFVNPILRKGHGLPGAFTAAAFQFVLEGLAPLTLMALRRERFSCYGLIRSNLGRSLGVGLALAVVYDLVLSWQRAAARFPNECRLFKETVLPRFYRMTGSKAASPEGKAPPSTTQGKKVSAQKRRPAQKHPRKKAPAPEKPTDVQNGSDYLDSPPWKSSIKPQPAGEEEALDWQSEAAREARVMEYGKYLVRQRKMQRRRI